MPEDHQSLTADPAVDARWFPEAFDARRGEFRFVATDRDELSSEAFLDGRWDRAGAARKTAGIPALRGHRPAAKPKPNFIWHTGFCCSTLLAKALDRAGKNLSLCEPQILVEIADAKRANIFPADFRVSVAVPTFQLLARSFAPGEAVTLKPSPAANALLGDAVAATASPMLFLYSDCRSFVVSITKMGEEGRKYVRRLYLALLADGHPQGKWPPVKVLSLSDLELATVVWHMQIGEFRRNWPTGERRAASLDCEMLLADPVGVLGRVDELFALGLGQDYLASVVDGPLFQRNAKTEEGSFNADRRRKEHSDVEQGLGRDLDRIVSQSYALCGGDPSRPSLPDPL